jgi:2'-hydroxybiphenyl-2-sulfinate desulfinase
VGNAGFIAANRNEFLKDAFAGSGVTPVLLQSLPPERWSVHYTHLDDALFREGGNIPAIWAHAEGAKTVLLGTVFLPTKRYILAAVDSGIDGAEDLRGKRLAIPVHSRAHIDFYKYGALRGFETALAARGVSPHEVHFIEIEDALDAWTVDLSVIGDKLADAVFVRFVKAQRMLASGKYKIVCELTVNPDSVWPINNEYPEVLTVSKSLAHDAPEIVIKYLKQTIRAAQWAKTHLSEVIDLFARQLKGSPGEVITSLPPNFHKKLEPGFSVKGLRALESQKRFLFDKGVITRDFDIESWADTNFLAAALRACQ